jgi:hypothetical protein
MMSLYTDQFLYTVLIADDPSKLDKMVTASHGAFRQWCVVITTGKTSAMRVHVPLAREGNARIAPMSVADQWRGIVPSFSA